jgi:hypothetical protein
MTGSRGLRFTIPWLTRWRGIPAQIWENRALRSNRSPIELIPANSLSLI